MLLSFVIPAFNEEESLTRLYREISQNVGTYDFEVIFVDDGSTDTTFDVMKQLAANHSQVKVIRFRGNFGKSAGLNIGFSHASGDVIFTMDADLQDDPREIPHFLEKLEEGYDLVTGWKKKRHDPINKILPSKIYNAVTSASFGLKLHDYNCGFKAYSREVMQELDIYGEMHRYVPALAHARGFRIAEIPVHHRKREFGKSKFGTERFLRGFLDLITVKLVTSYLHSPLYLFGRIGATSTLLGIITGLYLTILKFGFGVPLSNRPLLFLSVLLVMVGLQIFSIGLLGELIVNQNRRQTRGTRISIREKINLGKEISHEEA
ncbi:MAG: glycosyltransferase family 2 protein [Candidatus Cloacimonetes bacterium]|nr:glycosyltransferase family 2 protein [Candidatus Cloacimonadota bacterium]